MPKYRILNASPVSLSVAGTKIKPDKETLWEMDKAEAQHLAQVYHLEQVDEKGKVIAVLGIQNAGGASKPKTTELSKATLVEMGRDELEDKCKALKLKIEKDDSKGDLAEKIMAFVETLGKISPKKGG